MAAKVEKKKAPVAALRVNERKWTKTLWDAGWTAIPNVIFERQKALGLDPLDINIILHLASYWWEQDNKAHPSKARIAAAMDVDPRTIQRRIAKLEGAGLMRREERRVAREGSKTNLYHFDGLIAAARPFAEEKVQEIKRRRDEDKARLARKRPKLTIVKGSA